MINKRNNFVIQLVGTNFCGKTTLSKRFAKSWREARPEILPNGKRKYQVIAFDPKRQFDGLVDEYIRPEKDWAIHVTKKARNALIILDDYKTLLPNYDFTPGMFELFAGRWHNNLDFIVSCHAPGHIILKLIDYITEYYIYHIKPSRISFKDRIPDTGDVLSNMSETINKYVATYGMGKHPLDPDFKGQTFPYMTFDTTKADDRPKAYNMKKDFLF